MPDAATAVLEAECGKGTYVRALARDMGRALGSAAHVIGLRRTRVGGFDEAVSVDLQTLREAAETGTIGMHLRPVEAALDDIPGLSVGPGDAANLARGQAVLVRGRDAPFSTVRRMRTSKAASLPSASWKKAPSGQPACSISAEPAAPPHKAGKVNGQCRESGLKILARPDGSCIRPALTATLLDDIPAVAASRAKALSQTQKKGCPMSISPERKTALIKDNATKANDTGSPEVQIAILTERINT